MDVVRLLVGWHLYPAIRSEYRSAGLQRTYTGDFDKKGANVTSDPYFGKKIAGGRYVSGEGSYIEQIGDHYYLFMSYGGLEPNGGYEMRVFRTSRPDGPYKDMNGTDAIFTSWKLNYGPNADTRVKSYWSLQPLGIYECR